MSRTKKPRKQHTAHAVRVPITQSLVDEFGMSMHTSLAVLEHAPSMAAFDAIGACLNIIGIALKEKALLAREFMPVIQSGVLALQQIGNRAERLGKWHATTLELVPVKHAVGAAEQLLGKFQVFDLYRAMQVLKALHAQDQQQKNTTTTTQRGNSDV